MINKRILTYGTFDLFHVGHLNILRAARALGGELFVGLSTDEFNEQKNKKCTIPFADRKAILEEMRCVSIVFPETCWEQKVNDILTHKIDVLVMGSDWEGRFDHLRRYCEVIYLQRTPMISTTKVKETILSGAY